MKYYIFFDRLHVDTKEPLGDYYCWTFDDPDFFNAEVKRLTNPKMDHIKVIASGLAIEKP